MSRKADSFLKNYGKLKQIAETMRDISEPDIDHLITMVDEATRAYKSCQSRIEAVEKAIGLTDKKGVKNS
jgi:exodeoxyribonuclease VII small subunit